MTLRLLTPGTPTSNSTVYSNSGGSSAQYLSTNYSGFTLAIAVANMNAAYVGNWGVVRRSGDDAEQTIGFGFDGFLDWSAVASFIGVGNAFVKTVFDTSGNGNDATQTTKAKQWQLIQDADGIPSFVGSTTRGMAIASSGTHETSKIESFSVLKNGITTSGTGSFQVWLGDMPASPNFASAGGNLVNWGIGIGDDGLLIYPVNHNYFDAQQFGSGYSESWQSLNFRTDNGDLKAGHSQILTTGGLSGANVSYSGTRKLCLGMDFDGNFGFAGKARAFVLYGTNRSDRDSISAFMEGLLGAPAFPTSQTTSEAAGFLWSPKYVPGFPPDAADSNGLAWWKEHGGYKWSHWAASNVNNGDEYVRFEVRPGDRDAIVTQAERAERATGTISSLKNSSSCDLEIFGQFLVEAGSTQSGDWCDTFQVHYGSGEVVGSPDMAYLSLLGDNVTVISGRNGAQTNRSSAIPFSRSTWYAVRFSLHWSSSGSADTLQVWLGPNGGTLTQITNVSGSLFNNGASTGYVKQGIYRGFPNANAGNLAMQIANFQASATANAFSSFVTSQPALPTHA